jgi:hypothetical protein
MYRHFVMNGKVKYRTIAIERHASTHYSTVTSNIVHSQRSMDIVPSLMSIHDTSILQLTFKSSELCVLSDRDAVCHDARMFQTTTRNISLTRYLGYFTLESCDEITAMKSDPHRFGLICHRLAKLLFRNNWRMQSEEVSEVSQFCQQTPQLFTTL